MAGFKSFDNAAITIAAAARASDPRMHQNQPTTRVSIRSANQQLTQQ
jgi:hypothetical protein